MSFTIFQNHKTPYQAIKTRSSKSRKIDIFPMGLTHRFGQKMAIFPTFVFQAKQATKMSLTIFQNKKTFFKATKTKTSKSRKIYIFPKGLTHGFGPKMAIFPIFFFLGILGQENVFYDILGPKSTFLGYKNTKFKKSKNLHFSKGLNDAFCPKISVFQTFFLRNIGLENVFYDILEPKKRLSSL